MDENEIQGFHSIHFLTYMKSLIVFTPGTYFQLVYPNELFVLLSLFPRKV